MIVINIKVNKVKKLVLALIVCVVCGSSFSGQVGLPVERLELPVLEGSHLLCVWDETAGEWLGEHEVYDNSRSFRFEVPELGKWYWFGLWDEAAGEYVYEKWIGHFPTTSLE